MDIYEIGGELNIAEEYKKVLKNNNKSVLDMRADGGLTLYIFYDKPTEEEKEIIREQRINVKLLMESNFILPMIGFGNNKLLFELSFDPTVYDDDRVFNIKENNNTMTIILVDSSNFRISAIRVANLPLKFIQICTKNWARAVLGKDFSRKYNAWYRSLRIHSMKRLWNKASDVGKMGETYNLEELKFDINSDFYI